MIVQRSSEEAGAVVSAFGSSSRLVISRAYQMSAPNQSILMARSFDFATSVSSPAPARSTTTNNCRDETMNSESDQHADVGVPRLPVTITPDQLEAGARAIVGHIRPQWAKDTLAFKIFTDGITNRLIGVYQADDQVDMILIRVYGEKTDLFIDRAKEVRNMKIMFDAGLSAPIHCTFANGIAYGFSPGVVLDEQMVRNEAIAKSIAQKMAKMHTLQVGGNGVTTKGGHYYEETKTACVFQGIHKFLDLLSGAPDDGSNKDSDLARLKMEASFLEVELPKIGSPIVFCHNDLLLKNIIYSKAEQAVTFIDFEYSDYNYQAFDIANHFCEFCGVDSFQPELYPDIAFQRRWLRNYLAEWHRLRGLAECSVTDDKVVKLQHAIDVFALAANFYWAIWALVQAANSSIKFDYRGYAKQRLDEYSKRKQELTKKALGTNR